MRLLETVLIGVGFSVYGLFIPAIVFGEEIKPTWLFLAIAVSVICLGSAALIHFKSGR